MSGDDESKRGTLKLPEQVAEAWRKVRGPLKEGAKGLDPDAEVRLGGGSVLAARWNHRASMDVDVFLRTRRDDEATTGMLREAARNAGGQLVANPAWPQKEIRFEGGGHVDVLPANESLQRRSSETSVEGELEAVSETAEILFLKLKERGGSAHVRDAFDVVCAGKLDPEELTRAVNALTRNERWIVEARLVSQEPFYEAQMNLVEDRRTEIRFDEKRLGRTAAEEIANRTWVLLDFRRVGDGVETTRTEAAGKESVTRCALQDWPRHAEAEWYDAACMARGMRFDDVTRELQAGRPVTVAAGKSPRARRSAPGDDRKRTGNRDAAR